MIKTSAPGKLVLLGEYAVLESGRALVMAVNRRVHVTLTHGVQDVLKVSVLPLLDESVDVRVENDQLIVPVNDRPHLRLVVGILQGLRDQGVVDLSSLVGQHLVVDSHELFQGKDKLGLGSSAAVTVALTGALYAWSSASIPTTLETLIELHRMFQGSGSGLDIAASFQGGLIGFRREGMSNYQVETLQLPQQLELCPIWAGQSADTGEYLARISAFGRRHPKLYVQNMDLLSSLSALGIQRLQMGDGAGFVDSIRQFGAALKTFSGIAGVAIVSEAHQRIHDLLSSESVAYKSCGAGGGDLGVAVSCAQGLADRVAPVLAQTPFKPVDLALDRQGLRVVQR